MKQSIIIILIPVFLFLFCKDVYSIPSFARKYQISCQTCHAPSIPKLKAYGDDFAGDAFKLQDYQSPRYFIETGDKKLNLMRNFPVAIRMDGYISYNFSDEGKADLAAPYLIKFMSGSNISEHLAYYFYFYMNEHGQVAGVEDAFLMFNDLLGQDLDIYLGQFQVCDPLFKRELRLTFEDYHVYTTGIGMSDMNMKYDKGIMITWGLNTGTSIIAEVVNGNGLADARAGLLFDKDKYKNVLLHLSQDIGDFLRIGGVGYYGKEEVNNNMDDIITNTAFFAGPDATLTAGDKLELNIQYIYRNDAEVFSGLPGMAILEDVITHGWMGELVFSPKGDQSNWYGVGLLNWIESDFDPADYRSATLHLGYLMQRNLRFGAEYSFLFTNEEQQHSRFSLGFVSAF